MNKHSLYVIIAVIFLVVIIVTVDVSFFKDQVWERLMVNVGIVLVFIAFYVRFLK